MRQLLTVLVAATFLLIPGLGASQQAGVQVVGNAGSTPESISQRDLERVFLKKRSTWPTGGKADPVDHRDSALREAFCEKVLGKSVSMVDSHWQAQVFSGRGTPPEVLESDSAMIEYVKSHPGAVGYVRAGASTSGVRVIRVTD